MRLWLIIKSKAFGFRRRFGHIQISLQHLEITSTPRPSHPIFSPNFLGSLTPLLQYRSLLPFFHSSVPTLSLHSLDPLLHLTLLTIHFVTHSLILLPLSHPTPKSHSIPSPLSFPIFNYTFSPSYSTLSLLFLTPLSQPLSLHLNHHSQPFYPHYLPMHSLHASLLTSPQSLNPLSPRSHSPITLHSLTPTHAILIPLSRPISNPTLLPNHSPLSLLSHSSLILSYHYLIHPTTFSHPPLSLSLSSLLTPHSHPSSSSHPTISPLSPFSLTPLTSLSLFPLTPLSFSNTTFSPHSLYPLLTHFHPLSHPSFIPLSLNFLHSFTQLILPTLSPSLPTSYPLNRLYHPFHPIPILSATLSSLSLLSQPIFLPQSLKSSHPSLSILSHLFLIPLTQLFHPILLSRSHYCLAPILPLSLLTLTLLSNPTLSPHSLTSLSVPTLSPQFLTPLT